MKDYSIPFDTSNETHPLMFPPHNSSNTQLFPNQSLDNATLCEPIPVLETFRHVYGSMHGYIAMILCPLAVVSNIFNVIVLNQRSMISPTNFLLTCLAVSDGLLMTSYTPFAAYFLIGRRSITPHYGWAVFMLIHINLQNFLHSASCNFIVILGVFRVLYVRCLVKCQILCSMQRARLAVSLALVTSLLIAIPCFISHHIQQMNDSGGEVDYMVTYRENPILLGYLYWNTAIFLKLLPLICLMVLSFILIFTIRKRNAKMRKLKRSHLTSLSLSENGRKSKPTTGSKTYTKDEFDKQSSLLSNHNSQDGQSLLNSRQKNPVESERNKVESRMTRLLLTIVLIFMIALLPQAILLFLNGFLGDCFTETVYNALGDFTDLLTIMNNCINFVLYCSMSRQFRTTFLRLFCPWSVSKAQSQATRTNHRPISSTRLNTQT